MNLHDDNDNKTTTTAEQPTTNAGPSSDVLPAAPVRRPRGFAAMDPERAREISRKGGKAAHAAGTAHEFTSDEARVAGRKGGIASRGKRRVKKTAPETPAAEPTEKLAS